MFEFTSSKYKGLKLEDEDLSIRLQKIVDSNPINTSSVNRESYAWNEVGISELFSNVFYDRVRYCPERNSWMSYDNINGVWVKDTGNIIISKELKVFCQLMEFYLMEKCDHEQAGEYSKFLKKLGDRNFREKIMKDARDVNPVFAHQFDSNKHLINCKNGTLDLLTNTFREHSFDDYITMQTNCNYVFNHQTYTKSNKWNNFITQVMQDDSEKIKYLQKALGYSMLGSSKEECMFIMYGRTTRNGKSTLASTIEHLMGDYATVSPTSIICKSSNTDGNAASPSVAMLKGKRLSFMNESQQYGKIDEEVVKQLTGGEKITARNLYENTIVFEPQFTMWLSCNDLPSVSDRGLFASNRLRVITFNRHFRSDEQDKNLKDIFKDENEKLNIFKWLVDGYYLYLKEGLIEPESVIKAIKQYELDNDNIVQFLEEHCIVSKHDSVELKTLYDTYKIYCRTTGTIPYGKKKFKAGIIAHPEWCSNEYISNGQVKLGGFKLK